MELDGLGFDRKGLRGYLDRVELDEVELDGVVPH